MPNEVQQVRVGDNVAHAIRTLKGIIHSIGENPDALEQDKATWLLRIVQQKLNAVLHLLDQNHQLQEGVERYNVNVNTYKKLKREYDKAVKLGKDKFVFDGREMMVEFVKYLLQHLEHRFGGINENVEDDEAMYVEYIRPYGNEKPFTLKTPNGVEKFEYCLAKYPSGKEDIAVYAYRGDLAYGYQAWKKMHNLP